MLRPLKLLIVIPFFVGSTFMLQAQDIKQAKHRIHKLCSKKFAGRGYVKNGDAVAASYIKNQLIKLNVLPQPSFGYYYDLHFPVNTFPKKVSVAVGNKKLIPGVDFLVDPSSPSVKKTFETYFVSNEVLKNTPTFAELKKLIPPNTVPVIDTFNAKDEHNKGLYKALAESENYVLVVKLVNKLPAWSVATEQKSTSELTILRNKFKVGQKLKVHIAAQWIEDHKSQNVIGWIPGTRKPDSLLVLTAHYDHLGMMGKKAMFPGANDNAGGVAMLLDLASYYKQHPPEYTVMFIFFAGEEAGLLGSGFYAQKPTVNLSNIRFLLNLDLVCSGEEGATVVNATVFPQEFALLDSINNRYHFLPKITKRGKAANSDHYFFSEAGVHANFWYLGGPYHFYHDVFDKPNGISLAKYNETCLLIHKFFESLQYMR